MRKSLILSVAVLIVLVTSCIPSLHPIVQPENAITDDRIVGSWQMGSNITIEFNSLEVETDEEGVDPKELEEELKANIADMMGKPQSVWTFERAYDISFLDPVDSSRLSINPGKVSDLPDGWVVESKTELQMYILTHEEFKRDDTITTTLNVYLTEIAGELFMDFQPQPWDEDRWEGRFGVNYIMGHTFAKVLFEDGGFKIQPLDGGYIEKLIKRKRVRLKHEVVNNDQIILTASTDELRAFIAKYVDDADLYDDTETMTPFLAQ